MRSKRLAIIAFGIVLASCYKRPGATAVVPPPTIVTVVIPVVAPVPAPMDIPASLPAPGGDSLFEQGELAFGIGDYVAAIQDYENYLQSVPNGDRIDEALFRVGMAYVLRTKPPANWTRARVNLRRLVNEHPDSLPRPTATLIPTI